MSKYLTFNDLVDRINYLANLFPRPVSTCTHFDWKNRVFCNKLVKWKHPILKNSLFCDYHKKLYTIFYPDLWINISWPGGETIMTEKLEAPVILKSGKWTVTAESWEELIKEINIFLKIEKEFKIYLKEPERDSIIDTPEQQARDILEIMGIEDAQRFSSGDVLELAELISSYNLCKTENEELNKAFLRCSTAYREAQETIRHLKKQNSQLINEIKEIESEL